MPNKNVWGQKLEPPMNPPKPCPKCGEIITYKVTGGYHCEKCKKSFK